MIGYSVFDSGHSDRFSPKPPSHLTSSFYFSPWRSWRLGGSIFHGQKKRPGEFRGVRSIKQGSQGGPRFGVMEDAANGLDGVLVDQLGMAVMEETMASGSAGVRSVHLLGGGRRTVSQNHAESAIAGVAVSVRHAIGGDIKGDRIVVAADRLFAKAAEFGIRADRMGFAEIDGAGRRFDFGGGNLGIDRQDFGGRRGGIIGAHVEAVAANDHAGAGSIDRAGFIGRAAEDLEGLGFAGRLQDGGVGGDRFL